MPPCGTASTTSDAVRVRSLRVRRRSDAAHRRRRRRAIGDDGRSQRLIRTVHGRGYQFVGELRAQSTTPAADPVTPVRAHRLPAFGTRLIGRDDAVARVTSLLESSRLVTVVGPGGVGKTRLAVAVAARQPMPPVFVDLTLVSDPALVVPHIAAELDLTVAAGDAERICAAVDGLPLAIELAPSHVRTLPRRCCCRGSPRGCAPRAPPAATPPIASGRWPTRSTGACSCCLPAISEHSPAWVSSSAVPLELVEAVLDVDDDAIGVVGRLVDRSLVRAVTADDGARRFGMLAVLRERAVELLDADPERAAVHERHAAAVAAALEAIRAQPWSLPTATTATQIAELVPEARTAFRLAADHGRRDTAGRIVGALAMYRHHDGRHAEGRRWLDDLRPHVDALSERSPIFAWWRASTTGTMTSRTRRAPRGTTHGGGSSCWTSASGWHTPRSSSG